MTNQIDQKSKQHTRLIFPALLCAGLWGSASSMIKLGYQALAIEGISSILLFAGIRFFLGGLLVFLFQKAKTKKWAIPSQKEWSMVIVLALFQTIGQYFFFYVGLAHSTGTMGAILSGTIVIFSVLLSSLIFHLEKINFHKILGMFLGFLGVLVMNFNGFSWGFTIQGEGFLLMAQVCNAISAVLISIFAQKSSAVLLSAWQFMIGGSVMALGGLASGGTMSLTIEGVAILLWLALVSGAAYTLWGVLLSQYPVSKVSVFTCAIPIFGVLFSALLLQEAQAFSWNSMVALILIVSSIWLINTGKLSKEEQEVFEQEVG